MSQAAKTEAARLLVGILRGKFYVWTPDRETRCDLEGPALREALRKVRLGRSTVIGSFASIQRPELGGAPADFRARVVVGRAVRAVLAAQPSPGGAP